LKKKDRKKEEGSNVFNTTPFLYCFKMDEWGGVYDKYLGSRLCIVSLKKTNIATKKAG
jgi:hypothetical protein